MPHLTDSYYFMDAHVSAIPSVEYAAAEDAIIHASRLLRSSACTSAAVWVRHVQTNTTLMTLTRGQGFSLEALSLTFTPSTQMAQPPTG
jgi:hypothetical protein